jgi:hypothetical protein
VNGKPDYTYSDLDDDDSEKNSTSEGDSSTSSSEEENPKKRKWYQAKPEYVIRDGSWVEMEQRFNCHEAPVSVRYSEDGSSYFCMKRSFYNEKFNNGDWTVGMRLALKEQPGVLEAALLNMVVSGADACEAWLQSNLILVPQGGVCVCLCE